VGKKTTFDLISRFQTKLLIWGFILSSTTTKKILFLFMQKPTASEWDVKSNEAKRGALSANDVFLVYKWNVITVCSKL